MRLRFLGAPHVLKSLSRFDLTGWCKEDQQDEGVEAKVAAETSSIGTEVTPVRQLRQRRVGVGLWAIRRQKMERAAQLRPRIVVHMSRLRGRKTVAADLRAASSHKKRRLCRLPSASRTVSAADVMPVETKNGTNVGTNSVVDAADGLKLEENEVINEANNNQIREQEKGEKPSEDAVNSRPKRHIMHKKLVRVFASLNKHLIISCR